MKCHPYLFLSIYRKYVNQLFNSYRHTPAGVFAVVDFGGEGVKERFPPLSEIPKSLHYQHIYIFDINH